MPEFIPKVRVVAKARWATPFFGLISVPMSSSGDLVRLEKSQCQLKGFPMIRSAVNAILMTLALSVSFTAAADEIEILTASAEHAPIRVDIASLGWLSGQWFGAALGGDVEEVWLQPAAGTMAGVYRLVKEGRVVFYEIMTLGDSNGRTVMRLKHFHANLEGWEERADVVEFPLLKLDDRRAHFDGMTVVRDGDSLRIHLLIEDRMKSVSRIEVFRYQRGATL